MTKPRKRRRGCHLWNEFSTPYAGKRMLAAPPSIACGVPLSLPVHPWWAQYMGRPMAFIRSNAIVHNTLATDFKGAESARHLDCDVSMLVVPAATWVAANTAGKRKL